MKTKVFFAGIIAAILVLCCVFQAGAVQNQDAQYTNPETGYEAVIIDELDLLNESERSKLIEEMTPLTEYGNIVFWSTDVKKSDYIDQAREKRRSLYDLDSASILMINMGSRKVVIQSYGKMYEYITDSKARSITDNVSHYATQKDYYTFAKEAYSQMYLTMKGMQISEPMKYTSYAVIASMLGIIIALSIAFSKRHNPLCKDYEHARVMTAGNAVIAPVSVYETKREKIYVSSSSGSGCSGGSSCGGGGCSSCGGGGCGGGGGSSF